MKIAFQAITVVVVAAGTLYASDPFVGTWKLDKDKSTITGVQEQIKDAGANKIQFIFGDDSETILADGADHPSKWGGTWALKKDADDKWTETRKRGGKTTAVMAISLSSDGSNLTFDTKGTRPDGSDFTETVQAKRVGEGTGLFGTWEASDWQPAISDWVIKANGTDGLTFSVPAWKEHQDLKFDGKDYPDMGPRAAPGSTSSAKRVDERTIALTDKLKGKVIDTADLSVSDDGNTLTEVYHYPGEEKTQTFVFTRE